VLTPKTIKIAKTMIKSLNLDMKDFPRLEEIALDKKVGYLFM
jgi:hypothetical protein